MITVILLTLFSLLMVGITAVISKRNGPEFMISMFVGCIVLAAVLGSKMFAIGSLTVDGTIIVFSITFLLTDMLTEFYGKKEAMKAVWGGFIAMILAIGAIQLTILLPAADFWTNQDQLVSVLGSSWRIILASIIAYISTQHFDIWLYDKIKTLTKDKYLWLRNNGSTMTSQFLNTFIFSSIAFAGVAPLIPLIAGSYLVKITIAILDTPIMYLARTYYKK